jgi:hypothetical protein
MTTVVVEELRVVGQHCLNVRQFPFSMAFGSLLQVILFHTDTNINSNNNLISIGTRIFHAIEETERFISSGMSLSTYVDTKIN